MKPIAAGIEADGRNDDVVQLMAASSMPPPVALVNPFLYDPPIAPHIAAQETGRLISPTRDSTRLGAIANAGGGGAG